MFRSYPQAKAVHFDIGHGKPRHARPLATRLWESVVLIPDDFSWVDPDDVNEDQAKVIVEELDDRIMALRRLRSALLGDAPTCNNCGQSFHATRSDAKYCSAACRQKAHRERKA